MVGATEIDHVNAPSVPEEGRIDSPREGGMLASNRATTSLSASCRLAARDDVVLSTKLCSVGTRSSATTAVATSASSRLKPFLPGRSAGMWHFNTNRTGEPVYPDFVGRHS